MFGKDKKNQVDNDQLRNFIDSLLTSLEDPLVCNKIRKIIQEEAVSVKNTGAGQAELQGDIVEKEKECKKLRDELLSVQQKLTATENRCKEAEKEIVQLRKALKKAQADFEDADAKFAKSQHNYAVLQKEKTALDAVVLPFQKAFALYCALTPHVKSLLQNIFPHENLFDFIFCGVREDNLSSLWDFCANTIKNGGENLPELMSLFDFFLEWNHHQYQTPKFKRLALSPGEKYNEDTAQRDRTSVPSGKIETVIFQGFAYTANDKLVRKSIVHVG